MMVKVETVRGPISPEELKVTLSHEHLIGDFTVWQAIPRDARKRGLVDSSITLANRGELIRNVNVSANNLRIDDVDEAIEEVREYRQYGGTSMVEMTLPGVGRDPQALRRISEATGVNIVCSSGFYVGPSHPLVVKKMDVDGVRDFILEELTEGISYPHRTGIKAGMIKAGASYPMMRGEQKVIKGAALAQKETGAPFTLHPPLLDIERKRKILHHEKLVRLIEREGANLRKFYISHMDLSCSDNRSRVNVEHHRRLMDKYPLTLNYDSFGIEGCWDTLWPGALFVSDNERLLALAELCEQGYEKQLMISHDLYVKVLRVRYGGWGYAHILKHVIPRLRFMGVSKKQITTMIVENPKRMLAH